MEDQRHFTLIKFWQNFLGKALKKKKCDENCVQFIENTNRSNVDYLLSRMKNYIDLIIPRGGKSLS